MAEAPETIDIFSARPGDIVIYGEIQQFIAAIAPHTH